MRREWEDKHKVTEELVEGPPSRRANATLTPCPNGNHLWCIGGEFFSEDGKAVSALRTNNSITLFMNACRSTSTTTSSDTLLRRCTKSYKVPSSTANEPQDEWRKFVSPTCPGPRSAHAVVASPAGGGKLFLFGTSFPLDECSTTAVAFTYAIQGGSSLVFIRQPSITIAISGFSISVRIHGTGSKRRSFRLLGRAIGMCPLHQCLNNTLMLEKHRMAMWKHYIVLFGGFYDPGVRSEFPEAVWA